MIDEAFMPLSRMLRELLSFDGEIASEWQRTRVIRCELSVPVELSIGRRGDGRVEIGSTPPLYAADTTLRPSFHQVRLVAEVDDG